MKKIMLGTSDTWSMSHSSHRPSDPAYYIEDCWIFGLLDSPKKRMKLTTLSIFFTQDSEFSSFFGRIQETIYIAFDIYCHDL